MIPRRIGSLPDPTVSRGIIRILLTYDQRNAVSAIVRLHCFWFRMRIAAMFLLSVARAKAERPRLSARVNCALWASNNVRKSAVDLMYGLPSAASIRGVF